jgi:hypothetical protein
MNMKLLSAGLLSAAMLATPAMAQEATQEPGVMGYNYPNSAYLTGGYGHSFKPRPADYYYGYAHRWPSLRTAPEGYYYGGPPYYGGPSYYGGPYGYYGGPY